jgi:hypothetical protein
MQPIHSLEYELTSELAAEIHRLLVRRELRRSWRRDVPLFAGGIIFAVLIIWFGLEGWLLPAVGGGLLCIVALFVMGALFRRWSLSNASALTALVAIHAPERRVRLEFAEDRVRMETEFFRGEGAWTELDEVVVFPHFWVLYLANSGRIVIPITSLSAELEALIRAKAQAVMASFVSES